MAIHLVYPVLPFFYVSLRDVSDFIELYLPK